MPADRWFKNDVLHYMHVSHTQIQHHLSNWLIFAASNASPFVLSSLSLPPIPIEFAVACFTCACFSLSVCIFMWRAFMAWKAQKGTNVNLTMTIPFSSGVSFVTENAINVYTYTSPVGLHIECLWFGYGFVSDKVQQTDVHHNCQCIFGQSEPNKLLTVLNFGLWFCWILL